MFTFLAVLCNLISVKGLNDLMLPNNSLSFVTDNLKRVRKCKKSFKLTQYLVIKQDHWSVISTRNSL